MIQDDTNILSSFIIGLMIPGARGGKRPIVR